MTRRVVGNVISICISMLRISLIKLFHNKGYRGSAFQRISPSVVLDIGKGCIQLGKTVRIHSSTRLLTTNGGNICLGDSVSINVNCILASHSRITIGERTTIGPGVYIYDHDHDFRTEGGIVKDKYISEGVTIGKEVWIGAQTIILKGTVIGDNAVVGAGCVISEHIPSNTVYIQRRNSIIKHYDTDISRS